MLIPLEIVVVTDYDDSESKSTGVIDTEELEQIIFKVTIRRNGKISAESITTHRKKVPSTS